MMSYSRRSRYSRSPSVRSYSRSRSKSRPRSYSRSRSRSRESNDVENPGNNLYVTGLSTRVTKKELEKHFSSQGGTVTDVHLVTDPWTQESRGFGFVTMSTVDDADRCIKYFDGSVLGGRVITVEKAKRRRGRTPTPGRYLGLRTISERRRSLSRSPFGRRRYSSDRDRSDSPYYRHRSSSRSHYSRSLSRSYSGSPYRRSPVRRYRSYSRSPSPIRRRNRRRDRSYSRSPIRRRDRLYYRSYSRSVSPYRHRRYCYRSYSRSVSPYGRRNVRRSYSRSISPRGGRSLSVSRSPTPRRRSTTPRGNYRTKRSPSARSYRYNRSRSSSR